MPLLNLSISPERSRSGFNDSALDQAVKKPHISTRRNVTKSIDWSCTAPESASAELFEQARYEQEKALQLRNLKALLNKRDVRKTITYTRYEKGQQMDSARSSTGLVKDSSGFLSNFTIDVSKLEKSAARRKIAELNKSIDVTNKYKSAFSPERNRFDSQASVPRLSDISSNLRDSACKLRGLNATSQLQHVKITETTHDRSLRVDTETGLQEETDK